MTRLLGLLVATATLSALAFPARAADDKGATAVLDKAIAAMGGEAKLAKLDSFTWKSKGTITLNDTDSAFTLRGAARGIDRYRSEFEGEFGGQKVKGLAVIDGKKGWRKFGDMLTVLEDDALANEKRTVYLQIVPIVLLPLKGKPFKIAMGKEEKVAGKPAVGLKVTGPDGKDFDLYFDKASGLPVKLVAKVVDFAGTEMTQETVFGGYKDFAGIKKATSAVSKRDGEKFLTVEVTAFESTPKLDPKTFAEPE
jgi:hypothetical protein